MSTLNFNRFIKAFEEHTQDVFFENDEDRRIQEMRFLSDYLKSKRGRTSYYDRYCEVFRSLSPSQVKKQLSKSIELDFDIQLEMMLYSPCTMNIEVENEEIEITVNRYIDPEENTVEEMLIGATRNDGFEHTHAYIGSILVRNSIEVFEHAQYSQVIIPAPVMDGYKHWLKMGFMLRQEKWPIIQKKIAEVVGRTVHSPNKKSLISRFLKSGPRVVNALALDKGEQATQLFKDFQKTNSNPNPDPVFCKEEYYFDLKSKRQRGMLASFCKRRTLAPPDFKFVPRKAKSAQISKQKL